MPHDAGAAVDVRHEIEDYLDRVTLPTGFRAELVRGTVIIARQHSHGHERHIAAVQRQLIAHDWIPLWRLGIVTPSGRYIPDIAVVPRTYKAVEHDERWLTPEGVAAVIDVVEAGTCDDADAKQLGYARADLPLYVRIERHKRQTILYGDPGFDGYKISTNRSITEPVSLPAPFSFDLTNLV